MISGVTAEVSWVFKTAPATLTPTIAVPPRFGVACAMRDGFNEMRYIVFGPSAPEQHP